MRSRGLSTGRCGVSQIVARVSRSRSWERVTAHLRLASAISGPGMPDLTETELLPRERCLELMLAVQAAAYRHGVDDVEILLSASDEALTRFANNAIHQ